MSLQRFNVMTSLKKNIVPFLNVLFVAGYFQILKSFLHEKMFSMYEGMRSGR